MSDGGKGSAPRPISVSDEQYAARWDLIFARDDNTKKEALKKIEQETNGGMVERQTQLV